jgi:2-succinyl-6-hydroxy-2,4-cyclohexadiene-1-carboxylate synthase
MSAVAADLMAILDVLQIEKARILGYSLGGRLALFTAVAYPQRINSLILESASPGLKTEVERQARVQQDRELADWIEAEGIQAFVNRWEKLPLWQSQQSLAAATRQALRHQRLQNNPLGLAHSLRGMGTGAQPSQWQQLAQCEIPTLLITGELDQKFGDINRQMAGLLPQARLEIVAGAGHTVHLERPSQFAQIVLSFLQKSLEI